jgi:hypothetical protein
VENTRLFKTRVWYKELCSISFYVSLVESNSLFFSFNVCYIIYYSVTEPVIR